MNAPNTPPPGWYPDPSGQAPFRYWDGTRWTEHTNQGAPAPVQPVQYAPQAGAPPMPGAPAAPPMAGMPAMGAMGAMGGATAPAAAKPLTAQGFLDDLKRLDGFAIMLAAAALFIIATFLAWGSAEVTGFNQAGQQVHQEETTNAWSGDGAWLILGADTDTSSLTQAAQGGSSDGNTDLLILGPLLLIAVGVTVAMRQGKQIGNGAQIAAGAAVLFGVLVIAEVFHLSSAGGDIESFGETYIGGDWTVGVAYGAWIGAIAAVGVAFGGVRHYLATKTA